MTAETRSDNRALLWTIAVFAALSLWAGIKSDAFLEADACTHYQFARWCWREPSYLVNVWGRPFCTAIYALPALLADRTGTKITSLLIALAVAALTWRIARWQQYRWPALAGIFLLAQPLVFLHSFSELTELPFALLLAAAFLAYCQKRWWAVAVLVGLMPLARPEGFAFLFLTSFALALHRKPLWIFVSVIPLIAWNTAGHLINPNGSSWWNWLPRNWPYAAHSAYQSGSIAHFLALLPAVIGPIIFPFFFLGLWQNLRTRWFLDHRRHCDALIALLPLAVLAGHSVLYWRGAMASNGEIRYMLVVAPFWALLSARGWEWLFTRLRWTKPYLLAGAASLLPAVANFIYPVLPLHFDANWQHARELAYFYQHGEIRGEYPRILAAHPGISYFLHVSPSDPQRMVQWSRAAVAADPAGTLLIWDDVYSLYNSDENLVVTREQIADAGWKLLRIDEDATRPRGHVWAIYISAKPAH